MTDLNPNALKKPADLTDRELQERTCKIMEETYYVAMQQEKHLRYFSTVLTIYLVLTFIGIIAVIWVMQPLAS